MSLTYANFDSTTVILRNNRGTFLSLAHSLPSSCGQIFIELNPGSYYSIFAECMSPVHHSAPSTGPEFFWDIAQGPLLPSLGGYKERRQAS